MKSNLHLLLFNLFTQIGSLPRLEVIHCHCNLRCPFGFILAVPSVTLFNFSHSYSWKFLVLSISGIVTPLFSASSPVLLMLPTCLLIASSLPLLTRVQSLVIHFSFWATQCVEDCPCSHGCKHVRLMTQIYSSRPVPCSRFIPISVTAHWSFSLESLLSVSNSTISN